MQSLEVTHELTATGVQTQEGEGSQAEEDPEIDSEILVRETFKNLFPDSFDGVLPIRKHKVLPPPPPSCSVAVQMCCVQVAGVKNGYSPLPSP